MNLLHEWDKGGKAVRQNILVDFIKSNEKKTGPELDAEFAQAASLFLARLTAWLRLTYMVGTCLNEQLKAITIFVSSSSGHKFLAEFLEVGGVLTLLEIIGLKQATESDKAQSLQLLQCISNCGRKYKELVCESYGIRAIAECLAKSKSDETQDVAKNLLLSLAEGNPRFCGQVYRGLIALLPCTSPKAQQMAAQCLQVVQPLVEAAHPSIVEPLLGLLRTLHLEVQYEGLELIKLLMNYEVKEKLLTGLVRLLKPSREDIMPPDGGHQQHEILSDASAKELGLNAPLPVFVQQAAAAKAVGQLCKMSPELAERLVSLRVTHSLMFAMGNQDYADSQRQAAITLEYLCRTFPIVDEHVHEAMGDTLYEQFMTDPESLYVNMTAIQADVLLSNKVNVPAEMSFD